MGEGETGPSFFQQAAKASWLAPIVAIAANFVLRNVDQPEQRMVIVGLMLLVLYGLGLCLGLVALAGVSSHGRRGILVPALIGVLLNAGILVISFSIAASA